MQLDNCKVRTVELIKKNLLVLNWTKSEIRINANSGNNENLILAKTFAGILFQTWLSCVGKFNAQTFSEINFEEEVISRILECK